MSTALRLEAREAELLDEVAIADAVVECRTKLDSLTREARADRRLAQQRFDTLGLPRGLYVIERA